MNRFTACALGAVFAARVIGGCYWHVEPAHALQDVPVVEGPYIVHRGGDDYYLRIRIDHHQRIGGKHARLNSDVEVDSTTANGRGYVFFSVIRSSTHNEGCMIERHLGAIGMLEFAKRNSVYWLNPDGSTVLLEIREE